ncbi:MAG: hypothetical protein JNK38_00815 [Acidobacteria bacterium]|nr:hypothetical protein [Acidobacteriota bacterium]
MTRKIRSIAFSILCLIIFCCGLSGNSLAQSNKSEVAPVNSQDDTQVLRMLLNEVRQLRLTLQQTNVNAYRTQIALERLRLQQTRVDKLTRDLAELQMQMNEAASNRPRLAERLKELEASINQESDTARRANLTMEYKDLKFNLAQRDEWEQQQRDHEAQLNRLLQVEQAKLSEYNEQIDSLQRDLERLLISDKPASPPNRR